MNRRVVFTDIHGCFYTFKKLLEEQVQPHSSDQLFFLGDYISKGPYSRKVLDYLMQLQEQNFQLHLLRGNHEQELLNVLDGTSSLDIFLKKGGGTFLKSFGIQELDALPDSYIHFIRSFGYFIALPDFYLVHAGFDFKQQNPFIESEKMFNIRDYKVDLQKTAGRPVLHGHSPTDLKQILQSLYQKNSLHYSLDAGCVYRNDPRQAHLLALDLDSWESFFQPNIDHSDNYA